MKWTDKDVSPKYFSKCSFFYSNYSLYIYISQKYGLYCYECKDSRCNLCASYIQECASFIKHQMDITGKQNVILIVIVLMFYIFLSCNSCDGNTTYTGKTVNSRNCVSLRNIHR